MSWTVSYFNQNDYMNLLFVALLLIPFSYPHSFTHLIFGMFEDKQSSFLYILVRFHYSYLDFSCTFQVVCLGKQTSHVVHHYLLHIPLLAHTILGLPSIPLSCSTHLLNRNP